MMKKILFLLILGVLLSSSAILSLEEGKKVKYKCLIQLSNYGGEGAYVVMSLIDSEGKYIQTMHVNGKDQKWYEDLSAWYKFYYNNEEELDGITGASIVSGGRDVSVLKIDEAKINAGYKIRFETAVEDKNYYEKDLELELKEEMVGQKIEGSGYIRYIKIIGS